MISSSIALAVGIGPLVGGAITNTLGWPYLFLFMVISMIGIFLLVKFMRKRRDIQMKCFALISLEQFYYLY